LLVLASACSTALPVESIYDDEVEPTLDAGVLKDAAVRDAAAHDAAVKDAGPLRDAAASPDAGPSHNCNKELPTAGFASLVTSDCERRTITRCANQIALDAELVRIALGCKLSRATNAVDLGFILNASGCPSQFRYGQAEVQGAVSNCIQTQLEKMRVDCRLDCAVARVSTNGR
jgi:hypothetical protein